MRLIIQADTDEERELFLKTNTTHPLVFEGIQDFVVRGWQIHEGEWSVAVDIGRRPAMLSDEEKRRAKDIRDAKVYAFEMARTEAK